VKSWKYSPKAVIYNSGLIKGLSEVAANGNIKFPVEFSTDVFH
jgi:hypothetical protein